MTWPVPTPPPPPRVAVTVPVKPSAANAAVLLLVTERSDVVPECSVIEPPVIVGRDRRSRDRVDLAPAMFDDVVGDVELVGRWRLTATKVMTVPLTVMVSPAGRKLAEIEFVPAAADEQGRDRYWPPTASLCCSAGAARGRRRYRAPQACRAPADYVRRCMIPARSIPIRERKRHAWSSADSWRGWRDSSMRVVSCAGRKSFWNLQHLRRTAGQGCRWSDRSERPADNSRRR